MKTMSAACIAAVFCWVAGCSTPAGDPAGDAAGAKTAAATAPAAAPRAVKPTDAAAPVAAAGPEIVKLIDRQRTLTVRSSAEGPRYTLESPTGHVVVRDLTEADLAVKHPELLAGMSGGARFTREE